MWYISQFIILLCIIHAVKIPLKRYCSATMSWEIVWDSKYTDTRHWSVSSLHENKSYPTNNAEYRTCRMFWHLQGRRSIVPFPKRKQAKSGTYSTQSINKNNFSLVLKLFAMNHVYLGSSQLCPLLIF